MKSMRKLFSELTAAGYKINQFENGFSVVGHDYTVSVMFSIGNYSENRYEDTFVGWQAKTAEVGVWGNGRGKPWVKLTSIVVAPYKNSTSIMRYIRRYAPLS